MKKKPRSNLYPSSTAPFLGRTWLELEVKASQHNIQAFRQIINPKTKLLAVVKSNAYGHGLIDYTKTIEKKVDWLGVDSITEARALRLAKIKKPILILGYTLPSFFPEAEKLKINITISNFPSLKELQKIYSSTKKCPDFQIKIDSGMHRHGFSLPELPKLINELKIFPPEKITGLFSHLASPDDLRHQKQTAKQIKNYSQAKSLFSQAGFSKILHHLSATGGTIFLPEAHFDMVRIGMGLYGYPPYGRPHKHLPPDPTNRLKNFSLKPVLTWKTIIAETKNINPHEELGYDFTWKAKRPTKIAILPIGYWHGYPRILSNKGYVLINNKKAPVIGRVCMDIMMVDITNIPNTKIGQEVTLLGKNLSPIELGELAQTSHYEILTRLNPLMKKIAS